MDDKKYIKEFIEHICQWVESKHRLKGHDHFQYQVRDYKFSYLIADKGIEKRIIKQLFKKLRLKAYVKYNFKKVSTSNCLDNQLYIEILKEKHMEPRLIYIKDNEDRIFAVPDVTKALSK